jgi:hypothetical protein
MTKLTLVSRSAAVLASILIIGYLFFANTAPFDISRTYNSGQKDNLVLGPNDRINIINGISKQQDNLIYVNSSMPFKFDHAKVKIKFKNPSPDQQILLGYRDQQSWHYNIASLDIPWLNNIMWQKIGNDPYLYQKKPAYKSMDDFFKNPPQNKVVGVVDYSNSDFLQPNIVLPNYRPSSTNTTLNTPLRGKTTLYAYLNNEPFKMSFTKQDLNWGADPDTAKITVYKGNTKVYVASINDDGDQSSDHNAGEPQTIDIQNPGPGLPEPGVYKIVIDASDDTIITKINTNLHKIVFEGPLYVANNHEVYGKIVPQTSTTSLVTNAQIINFRSDHGQSTSASVGQQLVKIAAPNKIYSATNTSPTTNITIPKSDAIVNSTGYFGFTADQFFSPTPYKIIPINSADDASQADYILTNYQAPQHEADWLVAEREFNLTDAYIQKRQLSWLIDAPGLKENKHTVEYKEIDMTLSKKGWFKQ